MWPTCCEFTIVRQSDPDRRELTPESAVAREAGKAARAAYAVAQGLEVESAGERALRRARSAVRRYNRHNGLTKMLTLTFGGEPPEYGSLSDVMRAFFARFERASGEKIGPYVWVPEWGTKTGRLHVHMAVEWWDRLGAVEVCDRCAIAQLRRKRHDIPAAGSFCVGCLWRHGFVGRPESNGDGRGLSSYLSKYLGKDLGKGLTAYQQSYRVAEGFKPASVTWLAETASKGVSEAIAQLGAILDITEPPIMFELSSISGYNGPPAVFFEYRRTQ